MGIHVELYVLIFMYLFSCILENYHWYSKPVSSQMLVITTKLGFSSNLIENQFDEKSQIKLQQVLNMAKNCDGGIKITTVLKTLI